MMLRACEKERVQRHIRNNESLSSWLVANALMADDDALAAGRLLLVHVLVLGRAGLGVIGVSASGASTVELDTVTSTGDTVALTRAAGAARADAGRA